MAPDNDTANGNERSVALHLVVNVVFNCGLNLCWGIVVYASTVT